KDQEIVAFPDDYDCDRFFVSTGRYAPEEQHAGSCLARLAVTNRVYYEGQQIEILPAGGFLGFVLVADSRGLTLRPQRLKPIEQLFENGVGRHENQFSALLPDELPDSLLPLLKKETIYCDYDEIHLLLTEVLPLVRKYFHLDDTGVTLPELAVVDPLIDVTYDIFNGSLFISSKIVYPDAGGGTVGLLDNEGFKVTSGEVIARRMPGREEELLREIYRVTGHSLVHRQIVPDIEARELLRTVREQRGWQVRAEVEIDASEEVKPQFFKEGDKLKICVGNEVLDPPDFRSRLISGGGYFSSGDNKWFEVPASWTSTYKLLLDELLDVSSVNRDKQGGRLDLLRESVLLNSAGVDVKHISSLVGDIFSARSQRVVAGDDYSGGILRDYQCAGVNWLQLLKAEKLGALLADDMGLGKTLQAMAVVGCDCLIVCPASVIHSWKEHLEKFRPSLKLNVYWGATRNWDTSADVVVTSYGTLRVDSDVFSSRCWNTVIIDEAQVIKNPFSQISEIVRGIRADFRLALTGTPVENRLLDLWSIFSFCLPGYLGQQDDFSRRFEVSGDGGTQLLGRIISPFMLRRRKSEVAQELPAKTEILHRISLSAGEKAVYGALLVRAREVLGKQGDGGVMAVLDALLRLRQAASDMRLLPSTQVDSLSLLRLEHTSDIRASKTEFLLQSLDELLAEGHKILVFSQWTSYLDIVEDALSRQFADEDDKCWVRLDGQTRHRAAVIDKFNNDPQVKIFLLSLAAGGVGINLTSADHVFLLDGWWNPAVEDQAMDRAHRLGQTKPVFVHRLISEGTVDEKIYQLSASKRVMADELFHSSGAGVSIDELKGLLSD
ncbi:MAG: DEAD/DEAH box helicase, partial [bacterium]|nr:DEAD/DEAH box helicase [bacterium]